MRTFAKVLIFFGILMLLLSSLLLLIVDVKSAEWYLCGLNIVIGGMMLVIASIYLFCNNKQR